MRILHSRTRFLIAAGLVVFLAGRSAAGESENPAAAAFEGKWTYRSFHNRADPVADDNAKALALYFAEATFTFEIDANNKLTGEIDWGSGGLNLEGMVSPASGSTPPSIQIVGHGRAGTSTEGWQYDYNGHLAHTWPDGVEQVPAIVGSVLRAKPHGPAPAGYVASFIAVKQ